MMIYTACQYFFWFILYSFLGWITETLLYLLRDGKVVKRGFLFGPLCPIYGFSCCLCVLALYHRTIHGFLIESNVFVLFFAGMLISSTLEYVTHFLMEKLFHAMWWDYSNRRFNIKGRIYLKGCLFFGLAAVLLVKIIQPFFVKITDMLPPTALYWICFALYTILLIDVSMMVNDLKDTALALKNFQSELLTTVQKSVDQTGEQLDTAKKAISDRAKENPLIKRFKKKYPNFTFKKYKYILDIIADPPQENKGRKDIKLYGTADTLPGSEEKNAAEKAAQAPDADDEFDVATQRQIAADSLAFLKTHIDNSASFSAVTDAFAELCAEPTAGETILFEAGANMSDDKKTFTVSLARQIPNGEGAYFRICAELSYHANKKNRKIEETQRIDPAAEDAFAAVRQSAAFAYADARKAASVDLSISET